MSIRQVRRALILLLLVIGGATALWEVTRPAKISEHPITAAPVQFSVVQAAKSIARGAVLSTSDLELHSSAQRPAPDTFTRLSDATGRVAVRAITKGEGVSDRNTAALPQEAQLSDAIAPGLRAISLRVTDETAVANFIRPGDHVDVLLVSNEMRTPPSAQAPFPPAEARTVLQDLEVLAVGTVAAHGTTSNAAGKNTNSQNVTLAVTPQQAATVAMIRSVGREYLTLRPKDDDTQAAPVSLTTRDLAPHAVQPQRQILPVPAVAPAIPVAAHSIEVISGASSNVSRLPLQGSK